ncbi:uncharacterized protein LOC123565778 [Mercenaria mercenaria]|uniref:uncharacterized protein LOC123565778 n=1 Tax=Mercenaria mercenaria TaxID=6596 RepID=UPI00234ED43C|nr:uncharacterized protein LOC123565778 [Mercenaria mercenaria]
MTPGQTSQRAHSGYQSTRSGWSPGIKRVNRQKPRTVYLKYMTETQEVQTPVIKGLVIDVVDNQKPSVVRASKNANIREEFALRQRVEGYRAACSQNINEVNLAQKKLCANLLNMKKKMAARAKADDKIIDDPLSVKTLSEELFLQSKGYFPETRPGSRAYNFPPLTYPKRRLLTIS